MNLVLLGSGNLATHLGQALMRAGVRIVQVWSRTEAHAKTLATLLNTQWTTDLSAISPAADLYIIALKDDVIAEVAHKLPLQHSLIVHTSGSTPLSNLDRFTRRGVFYPVQTFSKARPIDFKTIPIAIEGNTPEVLQVLRELASRLSHKVIEIDSAQRMHLHLAAVFACNFTNHLYHLAADILRKEGLDFDLLRPLIAETSDKVQSNEPLAMQTGPALRRDHRILAQHEQRLTKSSLLLELYRKLSQSILEMGKKSAINH